MLPNLPDCLGLDLHRSAADLQMLPQLVDTLRWVSPPESIASEGILFLPGLWLADAPRQAADVIRGRCSAGRHTIVVPRFRAGALTAVLGSPSSVEMSAAEFKSFEWGDQHYKIPGFTVIRTSLHAGKWGEAPGVGIVLLSYRPSTVSGAVILCAAAITSRLVGVSSDAQKELLHRITAAASAPTAKTTDSIESPPLVAPASIDEFLDQERELGAAYLLCRLAVADPESADLTEVAKDYLSIHLSPEEADRLGRRLPPTQNSHIRDALHRFGWGAYLRRLAPPIPTSAPGALIR
jgi:hypothetical protein